MKLWVFVLALIIFCGEASSVAALDYFVDQTSLGGKCDDNFSGISQAQPWCTIAAANRKLRPGDTVYIRAGIYDETIFPQRSGNSGKPITYTNFADEKVVVQGRPGDPAVVNIGGLGTDWQHKSHIIVDGLYIQRGHPEELGNKRHCLVVIYGPLTTHNIVRNCILTGTDEEILTAWDNGQGLRVGGIAIKKASHNIIADNTVKNMTFIGVLLGGKPKPLNNVICNNHIHTVVQDGIHIGNAEADNTIMGLLIEGNEIHGSLMSDGIQSDAAYGGKKSKTTGVSGVIVRKNLIYDNAENNIDLKGASDWVIEDNILYQSYGNNDGGLKPRKRWNCQEPPCDNMFGGSNISKGARRYARDIIIRRNVIYDGLGGVFVGDGFHIYNNTILNNRRTYDGPNQPFCISDSCSRKPAFPGVYGAGEGAVIMNNILGDNGFAVSRWGEPQWHLDHNIYYWKQDEKFKGLAQLYDKHQWRAFSLDSWHQYFTTNPKMIGKDGHSMVAASPEKIFRRVGSAPVGSYKEFDFDLAAQSVAIDTGGLITHAVKYGTGIELIVADVRFFFDGFGVTDGDTIVIGANKPVRIKKINYFENKLVLAESGSWEAGDFVSLPFKGAAPDIGARESDYGSTAHVHQSSNLPATKDVSVHKDL